MNGLMRSKPPAGEKPVDNNGQDSRILLRPTVCAAAALALLVVPVYQLVDIFDGGAPSDLLWLHAAWRLPVLVAALACLAGCLLPPGKAALKLLLRLLAASVMAMMFGLFSVDALHPQGDPEQMVRGIIMATFAISLLSLGGGREVAAYFIVPLAASLGWLAWHGGDLLGAIAMMADPLMMLAIAMIASELFYRIRREQFGLERELRTLASVDALTGLRNRRNLEQRIAAEVSRSRRHRRPLAVAIGDLDHFKRVNDEFGHAVGDDVLRTVGVRIRRNLRTEDLAVRWGGEEFLLLLPDTDRNSAVQVADKIRLAVSDQPVDFRDHSVPITISFGVAQLTDEDEADELVRRADEAMYRAKSLGRNRVCT